MFVDRVHSVILPGRASEKQLERSGIWTKLVQKSIKGSFEKKIPLAARFSVVLITESNGKVSQTFFSLV